MSSDVRLAPLVARTSYRLFRLSLIHDNERLYRRSQAAHKYVFDLNIKTAEVAE